MAWDHLFKRSLSEFLKQHVTLDESVGDIDRKIDAILDSTSLPENFARFPNIFLKLKGIHIIEFKSEKDKFSNKDISKLIGYLGFYMNNKNKGIEELGTRVFAWMILGGHSNEFKELQLKVRIEPWTNGIYYFKEFTGLWIMNLNELVLDMRNMVFLINASMDKFNEFLDFLIKNKEKLTDEEKKYIRARCYIDRDRVKNMDQVSSYLDIRAAMNIAQMVREGGIKEVINAVGIKDVINAVGIKEAIETIGLQEFIKIIVSSYDIDEVKKLIENYNSKPQ